jgi:hypothetical protein
MITLLKLYFDVKARLTGQVLIWCDIRKRCHSRESGNLYSKLPIILDYLYGFPIKYISELEIHGKDRECAMLELSTAHKA